MRSFSNPSNFLGSVHSYNYAPFDCIFFTATLLQAMARSTNISHQMEYLLATGTLVSKSGLGLMQVGSRFLCKQCSADLKICRIIIGSSAFNMCLPRCKNLR